MDRRLGEKSVRQFGSDFFAFSARFLLTPNIEGNTIKADKGNLHADTLYFIIKIVNAE